KEINPEYEIKKNANTETLDIQPEVIETPKEDIDVSTGEIISETKVQPEPEPVTTNGPGF
ncbi:hypothetical protein ACOKXV_11460, partial [Sporosarcina psychrophila]